MIPSRTAGMFAKLTLLAAFATGCSDRQAPTEPVSTGTAELGVYTDVSGTRITSLQVEVTAPDMAEPIFALIAVEGGVGSGIIRVPAGARRTITVRAFDVLDIETHRGSKTVDVAEGSNPTVSITLQPLQGDVDVDVRIGSITIAISPATATLTVSESLQMTATIQDGDGNEVTGAVVWGSTEPNVAIVDNAGLVIAVDTGTALIAATFGNVVGIAVVDVMPNVALNLSPHAAPTIQSVALDVNDHGQVVGWSAFFGARREAFLWSETDGWRGLGHLGGGWSEAHAINDAGHVVGMTRLSSGEDRAFLWTAGAGMVDLGTLAGRSMAWDINDRGEVVGNSWTSDGGRHAFLWTAATGMIDLGPDERTFDYANAVNEATVVVGMANRKAVLQQQLGDQFNLGTLGGNYSSAFAINELGQVVGEGDLASTAVRGFLWTQSGGMMALPALGATEGRARDINDLGHIVGWIRTIAGHNRATLWTDAGLQVDLGSDGDHSIAFAINNQGQVVGQSDFPGVGSQAALWTIGTQ
jgi:probable HAF family extracellular repeat protein